ncbi:DUF4254 domain-containing protein [Saccharothrix luteola]|uniref:DUF4254 domain-containing protein n=1 Tax=Saccharothrix luteola TaxID=2893018 RepID=UPI001E58F495|nr:DUF4254 domain-containing protein [Saccharothrix luteola]MCC8250538.1 DUF4254 domain-containing protein [Saccharothrix luteola]
MVTATLHPNETLLLPAGRDITRAFGAEHPTDDHPMLVVVAILARRHQERAEALQTAQEAQANDAVLAACARALMDCARARVTLIEQIDRWAAETVPEPSQAALLHTETLGRLVDRMAVTWAHWQQLRRAAPAARRPPVRHDTQAAMDDVAALSNAYDDLLVDLRSGRRRLPTTAPGIVDL